MKNKLIILILLISILFTCSAKKKMKFNEKIKIDMEGYRLKDNKSVIVTAECKKFLLINLKNKNTVFEGKFNGPVEDKDTKDICYIGDFSEFKTEGTYYILVTGVGKSYNFDIKNDVYNNSFYKAMRSFYLSRCGTSVKDPGGWGYSACHKDDGYFDKSTGETGKKDVTGGWHDAGDYGKYVVNSGITVGTMLYMFERKKDKLENYKLDIPESKNQMPDILDEIKWNIDWMLKMQRSDGAAYHKIGPKGWPGFISPDIDKGKRYIFQISTCATADFAAVTAIAARIYKPYDSKFSQICLKASINAWDFLSKNPKILPKGGYSESAGSGAYGDKDDRDERFWAAVELYNTTGEKKYHDFIENNYNNWKVKISMEKEGGENWRHLHPHAMISYLYSSQKNKNSKIINSIKKDMIKHSDMIVDRINKDGYKYVLQEDEYFWGSNSVALNEAIYLLSSYELLGRENDLQAVIEIIHFMLGRNPFNMSFLSGVGDRAVMNLHNRPSGSDSKSDPFPGFLAGGPNKHNVDPYLKAALGNAPAGKYYVDHQDSYASNENAINWNAALVYVLSYIIE